MADRPFEDPAVEAVFKAYRPRQRRLLMTLRRLILDAAAETDGVGPVVECLKWGQPAYLPARPRLGTTVRIDTVRGRDDACAMYVHCQSDLASTFRDLYGDRLRIEGRRAVVFPLDQALPDDAVKHCASLALTYHLRARGARDRKARGPG